MGDQLDVGQRAVTAHYCQFVNSGGWDNIWACQEYQYDNAKSCLKVLTRPHGIRVVSMGCGADDIRVSVLYEESWSESVYDYSDPGTFGRIDLLLSRILDYHNRRWKT